VGTQAASARRPTLRISLCMVWRMETCTDDKIYLNLISRRGGVQSIAPPSPLSGWPSGPLGLASEVAYSAISGVASLISSGQVVRFENPMDPGFSSRNLIPKSQLLSFGDLPQEELTSRRNPTFVDVRMH
jgi:hypothetical protein